MIITKEVEVKITKQNIEYYSKIEEVDLKDIIKIKPDKLPNGSHKEILVACDKCKKERTMMYKTYVKNTENGKDYLCKKCNRERFKKTSLEKFGTTHPVKNKEIQEKIFKTNIDKYGVKMSSMLDEIEEKKQQTNLKKYGEVTPLKNKEIRQKTEQSMINKYGAIYPIQNENIKNKIQNTLYKNHGVRNALLLNRYDYSDIDKNNSIIEKTNNTKFRLLKEKYPNINFLSQDNNNFYINCDTCNERFKIEKNLFSNRLKIKTIICTHCNPVNSKSRSGLEIQLLKFIKENYNQKIEVSKRNIIKPYELDIFLPELRLAFEFNGLYWHNELNKPNNYHLKKTEECEKQGIQLIHIWEDDWLYKQDIIKSMIFNKLGKNKEKIYARKCEIKEINDNDIIRDFLDENHIQGFIGSKVKLGLYFNNQLVSLMTFGKKRKNMNSSSKDGEYELLRFCNKLNKSVIGGASKLFKYFIKTYNPKEVITYADRSYSNGNLYNQLGFTLDHKTKPNYYYIIDGIRRYRYGFRKDILVKEGYDKNKSEHEIMLERKIYRIYNSGNLKYNYIPI